VSGAHDDTPGTQKEGDARQAPAAARPAARALPAGAAAAAVPGEPADAPQAAAYSADGQAVDATGFYAIACDPARSVVVEACAGAGKTWMLVSRILRALLAGHEPQQILAITFTRKAAGEMRARLDEWLGSFSATHMDRPQRIAELRARGLDAAGAEALADPLGALQARLLAGLRPVEVRTFHGWFGQLLGQAPLALLQELGLPAAYTLLEDPAPLRPALLRAFHRAVLADAALADDYRGLIARHRRAVVLGWLDAAWARAAEIEAADAAGRLEASVPPAAALDPAAGGPGGAEALLADEPLRSALAALAAELATGAGKTRPPTAAVLQQVLQLACPAADPAQAFALAWTALFTKDDEPRKRLSESAAHGVVIAGLVHIQALRRQQQAHEDQRAMSRLARVLLQQYRALKRRLQLVDMADLERAALALLADPVRAGWVQERLDQRLRQVLIDEFQDTSPLQWRALQAWLSAYAGAGGGASGQRPPAVFIVGDPKQSIYRFRNAEPRVFAAARDFVRTALDGRTLACDHTRRTAPEVITALNGAFADAAREDGWPGWRAHTTAAEAGGALLSLPGVDRDAGGGAGQGVAVDPPASGPGAATGSAGASALTGLPAAAMVPTAPAPPPGWRDSLTERRQEPEEHRRQVEAAQIAQAVRALLGLGLAPGEVMVLARRRSTLALVADALAAQHLPHAVAEPLRLEASPEALDLIAVLDTLSSPGHDLALARALRSPLIGADDTDLLQLARLAGAVGDGTAAPAAQAMAGDASSLAGLDDPGETSDPGADTAPRERDGSSAGPMPPGVAAHLDNREAAEIAEAGGAAESTEATATTRNTEATETADADTDSSAGSAASEPGDIRPPRQAWCDALLAADPAVLSPALRRAQGMWRDWTAAAAMLPPHDLLDRIVHQGQAVARFSTTVPADRRAAALTAIDALLSAALALGGGRFTTLHGFVRELRAGRVPSSAVAPPDAVQLLTVHGAKGLEAPAVILADADPQARRTGVGTLLIDWPMDTDAPLRVAFLRSEGQPPPSLAGLWAEEQRARDREEINAVYVAATRARRWLLVSRTEPRSPAQPLSAWRRLAPRAQALADWLAEARGRRRAETANVAASASAPSASAAASAPATLLSLAGAGLDPTTVAVPMLPHWSGQSHGRPARPDSEAARDSHAARLGQAVHRLLEWAGRPGAPLAREAWPEAAAAAAAAQALPASAAAEVLAAAGAVLDSPACTPFFRGPGLVWAGNELPLAGAEGPLRVDRVVALRSGPATWSAAVDAPQPAAGAAAKEAAPVVRQADTPDGASRVAKVDADPGPDDGIHASPFEDPSVVWWVLDYKLGSRPGEVRAYREQLRGYRDALLAAQPGATVHAAFITGRGELVPL
jgi:ATP-dependent helicase/nuclease subunit A